MNLTIQRFYKGHQNYSEIPYIGCVPVFGQILNEDGSFIHYTMERLDTLIPEDTYKYCFYNSPVNGWVVMLKNVIGFSYIEHHGANWPDQLKGCTAHGLQVDIKTPQLKSSQKALKPWFDLVLKASGKILAGDAGTIIDGEFGIITYETLKQII